MITTAIDICPLCPNHKPQRLELREDGSSKVSEQIVVTKWKDGKI